MTTRGSIHLLPPGAAPRCMLPPGARCKRTDVRGHDVLGGLAPRQSSNVASDTPTFPIDPPTLPTHTLLEGTSSGSLLPALFSPENSCHTQTSDILPLTSYACLALDPIVLTILANFDSPEDEVICQIYAVHIFVPFLAKLFNFRKH